MLSISLLQNSARVLAVKHHGAFVRRAATGEPYSYLFVLLEYSSGQFIAHYLFKNLATDGAEADNRRFEKKEDAILFLNFTRAQFEMGKIDVLEICEWLALDEISGIIELWKN